MSLKSKWLVLMPEGSLGNTFKYVPKGHATIYGNLYGTYAEALAAAKENTCDCLVVQVGAHLIAKKIMVEEG